MKSFFASLLLVLLLVTFHNTAFSQMVGDNVFLQGAFVEIGIAPNGGFGSTCNAPAGYHPNNPGDAFYDPSTGTTTSLDSNLGFVADYGADGWTVGTPPYFGDFYLPGIPQEGWAIEIDHEESDAYIPVYYTSGTTGYTGWGGAAPTPGYGLSGTNISYSNSGGFIKGVWEGMDSTYGGGRLSIVQTTTLDTTKLFFTVKVQMINTGTTTLNNIYYLRTVDPDNDETYSGSYTTINKIVDQLPSTGDKVLVSATGTVYTNAYLGLGTKDSRAKCMIYTTSLTPLYSPDSLYNYPTATGYIYAEGTGSTEDVGIGLDYKIGTLEPGQCTSITYSYVLNGSYIDSALDATVPQYFVNNVAYDSSATINACSFDSVLITLQDGSSYDWTWIPDSFLQNTSGINNIIFSDSLNGTITYTITGRNAVGGCDSIKYYLTVNHDTFPGPSAPAVAYCQNAIPDTLKANGSYPKTWWTTPTGGIGSPVSPTPSTATPGVTYYYISEIRDSICYSKRSTDTVTIIALPPPPSVFEPNPYCLGQTFVPFATSTPTVLWYAAATGGTGSTISPTINTNIAGTHIYYVSDTVLETIITGIYDTTILGCESPRELIVITVKDSLQPAFNADLVYGCNNSDTVIFNNITSGAEKYLWNFGDGSSDTVADPIHVYATHGTFSVTLTAINGSCVANDSDSVLVYHQLKANFISDPGIICQLSPISFTNTSIGLGISNTWSFGNGATDTTSSPNYTYINSGTYTVTLITKDFVPCYDTATAIVYIDSQSKANIALTDTVICQGTYITLTGLYTNSGNVGETWYLGDGDSIKNENPISYAYNTAGIYTPSVTALYRACNDVGTSRTIVVLPQPVINLGPDTSICPGSTTITLADNINAENSQATWVWNTGQTTAAITTGTPGYYYATVNINNCSATDSVLIQNDCYMDIPNAFTPNNDGINDYFFPRQFLSKGLTSFKMDIYNRWGQLIFETTSLDGAGWDGKLNNIEQPDGVYVYVIDGTFKDGQKEHHQGNVTLLR